MLFFDSSNYFIFNNSINSKNSKKATTVITNKSNIICAKIFSKLTKKYMIISSSDGGKTWVKRIESDDPMMLLYDKRKEVIKMMAMLFATKVILGKISYSEVPNKLRDQVDAILIENGVSDLIER